MKISLTTGLDVFNVSFERQRGWNRESLPGLAGFDSDLVSIQVDILPAQSGQIGQSLIGVESEEEQASPLFIGNIDHEAGPLEWEPEAEVVMHRTEFWETFRDCLAKLPQRIADVFMLRETEEMETSQICEALNISPNNLWVMLHRARMALRECLEKNWFKEPQPEGHL